MSSQSTPVVFGVSSAKRALLVRAPQPAAVTSSAQPSAVTSSAMTSAPVTSSSPRHKPSSRSRRHVINVNIDRLGGSEERRFGALSYDDVLCSRLTERERDEKPRDDALIATGDADTVCTEPAQRPSVSWRNVTQPSNVTVSSRGSVPNKKLSLSSHATWVGDDRTRPVRWGSSRPLNVHHSLASAEVATRRRASELRYIQFAGPKAIWRPRRQHSARGRAPRPAHTTPVTGPTSTPDRTPTHDSGGDGRVTPTSRRESGNETTRENVGEEFKYLFDIPTAGHDFDSDAESGSDHAMARQAVTSAPDVTSAHEVTSAQHVTSASHVTSAGEDTGSPNHVSNLLVRSILQSTDLTANTT